MLKIWGWIGLIFLIIGHITLFAKAQPFIFIVFPLLWFGYILFIDSLVYKIKKKSPLANHPRILLGMFLLSIFVWKLFEIFNLRLNNWHYINLEYFGAYQELFAWISFSTVIPAFFETLELGKALFKYEEKHKQKRKLNNTTLNLILFLGIICLILPMILPKYFFPLIWLSLFLIFDPINYKNNQPSLIMQWENKHYKLFLILLITALILGFLWEFWNYFSIVKWIYTIPFVSFWKIFEMPILGYLGYIPFVWEVYAVWYFARSFFQK
jgi:hypothetical protein